MHTIRKFSVLAGLAVALGAAAPTAPAPAPSPLDDLAWMAGTWLQESEDGAFRSEETWSSPRADAMVGMFRMAQRGSIDLYELMSIELEGPPRAADGPLIPGQEPGAGGAPQRLVFRLRHFQRGLVPWESEKDGPLTFQAVSIQPNEAIFEDAARDFPRRVVYARQGEQLTIRLISASKPEQNLIFAFRRSAP
jgi:hypothetical protein